MPWQMPSQRVLLAAVSLVIGVAAGPAAAQAPDRERAQLLQMQQQVQRLQQDNAALQSSTRQDAEKLKKETEAAAAAQRELKQLRARSEAGAKETDALRSELAASREALVAARAEIERLSKEVEGKDASLATAARLHQRQEQAQSLLAERLKEQTARGDQCETQHALAMTFARSMIDRYEHDRLRLCEPFTGIWKPRAENEIQQLRDELSNYRLEVPAEAPR